LFLILGAVAALVGLAGFYAFVSLMPLSDKPGLLYKNPRMDSDLPSLVPLRAPDTSVNDALRQYFVVQYVLSREGYAYREADKNNLFVMAYSDGAVAEQYAAQVGPQNPRNPAALLGQTGRRLVNVQQADISGSGDVQTATVKFSTEIISVRTIDKTQWTATIEFHYSDAVASETTDPQTGENKATLQLPHFQVISYVVTKTY
jgi:type IV secretory pathway component VirB8